MKRDLPPYWGTQLAAIIIVFSMGTALFPIGRLAYVPTYYWEPDYVYQGRFEANLTAASPIANISVGYCDTIKIDDRLAYNASPVTLRIYNDTHHLCAMVQGFGGMPTYYFPASVELHFAPAQNYTVEFERGAEDTFFACDIYAYVNMIPPPAFPTAILAFPCFGIGAFLLLFGLVLTSNFVRRTRMFFWET